jgi:hypothetical protein
MANLVVSQTGKVGMDKKRMDLITWRSIVGIKCIQVRPLQIRAFHNAAHGSNLTPGITRRPAPLKEYEIIRVGGRVHAVVRFRDVTTDYSRSI